MLPNVELILACRVWVSSLQKLVVCGDTSRTIIYSELLFSKFFGYSCLFSIQFQNQLYDSPLPSPKKKKPDSCSFHICAGATLSLEIDLEPREVTQLVKCLPSITEALALQKSSMVENAYNPNTLEAEASSGVQGHPWSHSVKSYHKKQALSLRWTCLG